MTPFLRTFTMLATALALAACGTTPLPGESRDTTSDGGEIAIAFQAATGLTTVGVNPMQLDATPGTRLVTGSNGTLALTTLAFVIEEIEFDCRDGRDGCVDVTRPATFLDLPFDGRSVEVTRQAIPDGVYDELDFEIDDLDPEDEPATVREQRRALLATIRQTYASFPEEASMIAIGTFTPTGGSPVAFTTFLAAEVEIEMALEPNLVVQSGTPSRTVTVDVDPARWFTAQDGRVLDLSAYDFAGTGRIVRLDREIRDGFTDVRDDDDDHWDDDDRDDDDRWDDDRDDDDRWDDDDDVPPPSTPTAPVTIDLAIDPTLTMTSGSLRLSASNGVMTIDTLAFLVTEIELDCRDEGTLEDACFEFERPAMFANLPLDGDGVRLIDAAVPIGQYDEVEFDIDAFEDEPEWPTTQPHLDALLTSVRSLYPDFPQRASMIVSGTFTATGASSGTPFRSYLDADEDVTLIMNPVLDVTTGGASRSVTIYANPDSWFTRGDGTLIDLSAVDYATHGTVPDLSILRGSFRVAANP